MNQHHKKHSVPDVRKLFVFSIRFRSILEVRLCREGSPRYKIRYKVGANKRISAGMPDYECKFLSLADTLLCDTVLMEYILLFLLTPYTAFNKNSDFRGRVDVADCRIPNSAPTQTMSSLPRVQ